MKKNNLYVIYGPTAAGKTSMAIKLAKEIDGEIINADSRQIYRHMDIGTNKEDLQGIPGHLFDTTTPDKQISLAEYQKLAYEAIEDISKRGKNPILVGGTGLYIDAVIKGYEIPEIEPDMELRKELNNLSVPELQQRLNKDKLESLNESDRQNPRRLIRAIEKSQQTEAPKQHNKLKGFKLIFIKPQYDKEELFQKIDKRVNEMFENGLIEEVKELLKMGYSKDLEVMKGMGYKEIIQHLEGKITLEQAKELIKTAHKQYVKRQETWFKKYIS